MTDGWLMINKCEECNSFPVILPGKKKTKVAVCPECMTLPVSVESWNEANPKTKEE